MAIQGNKKNHMNPIETAFLARRKDEDMHKIRPILSTVVIVLLNLLNHRKRAGKRGGPLDSKEYE